MTQVHLELFWVIEKVSQMWVIGKVSQVYEILFRVGLFLVICLCWTLVGSQVRGLDLEAKNYILFLRLNSPPKCEVLDNMLEFQKRLYP